MKTNKLTFNNSSGFAGVVRLLSASGNGTFTINSYNDFKTASVKSTLNTGRQPSTITLKMKIF